MGVYHGKSGKVDFGGAVASILSWSLSVIGDVAESSYMGLSWKTFVAGFRDSSATVDAQAMTEASIQVGTNADLKLYIDATNYFNINTAICIEQTETVSMTEVGKKTLSFAADDNTGISYV